MTLAPTPPKHARCSACHSTYPCTQQDVYPDWGFVLPYQTFGYYGGFSDEMNVLLGHQRSQEWILCHDCVVKFFDAFPLLAEQFGQNHHPCRSDVPCCQFAWRATPDFSRDRDSDLVRTQTAVRSPDGSVVWQDAPPSRG